MRLVGCCLNQYSSLEAIRKTADSASAAVKPPSSPRWSVTEQEIDYHVIFKALELVDPIWYRCTRRGCLLLRFGNSSLPPSPFQLMVWWSGGTLTLKHFFATSRNRGAKLAGFLQINTPIVPVFDSYEVVSQGAGAMVLRVVQ